MVFDIATSLNLVYDPDYIIPVTKQLDQVRDGGFRLIDMNFIDWWLGENTPFMAVDWQDWVLQIKAYGEKNGITYPQAHAPMFPYGSMGLTPLDFHKEFDDATLRSIQASGMLGIKWIVIHAGYSAQPYNRSMSKQLKEANLAWFDQFVNEGQKHNVGIAIENMATMFAPKIEGFDNDRYCAHLEDLLDLVDSFGTKGVGVCWDTGHANLQGVDQEKSLRTIGDRLKALHIDDNNRLSDEHLAPFFGTIQWENIIKTLYDIQYKGVFTFETHHHVQPFPPALRQECINQLYHIGQYLVNLK